MIIKHGKSHHRTAGNDLLGRLFKAPGSLQQVCKRSSQFCLKVAGISHCLASYCHDPVHYRFSCYNRPVHSTYCIDIIYHTAGVCGKHRRIDLPAADRIDQAALSTLGIFRLQSLHLDLRLVFDHL